MGAPIADLAQSVLEIPPFIPFLAALATIPTSLYLLQRYRRTVLKLMMTPASPDGGGDTGSCPVIAPAPSQKPSPSGSTPKRAAYVIHVPTEIVSNHTKLALKPEARALLRHLVESPQRAAVGYLIAGMVFAALFLLLDNIFLTGPEARSAPLLQRLTDWLAEGACLMWPTALSLPFIAGHRGPGWRFIPPAVLLVAQTIFAMLYLRLHPEAGSAEAASILMGITLITVLPALVLLACGNRNLRSIGPLVLFAMTIAFFGLPVGGAAAMALLRSSSPVGGQAGGLAALVVWSGMAYLAWTVLSWVADLYARKRVSDHLLLVDIHFLTFCLSFVVMLAVGAITREDMLTSVLFLLPLVGYRIALHLGLAPLRAAAAQTPPRRLLLLRVFGPRAQSERLFEELAQSWRYIGNIQMIASIDLAGRILEPHTLLDFLGGRLPRRFVSSPEDLERKWERRDLKPDPDGRFRVNEFFCHDDTWREVLVRLVKDSDVVFMDLRGFSPKRQGCVFELQRLTDLMPFGRIILLVDDTTDVGFLARVLDAAWEQRAADSPNQEGAPGVRLRMFHQDSADTSKNTLQLLSLLADAATQPDPRHKPHAVTTGTEPEEDESRTLVLAPS